MSEEIKKEETPEVKEQPTTTPEQPKPSEPVDIDQNDPNDLGNFCISLLKRFNGYSYLSVCYPREIVKPLDQSATLRQLLKARAAHIVKDPVKIEVDPTTKNQKITLSPEFIKMAAEGDDDFKNAFCTGEMILIRVHKVLPKLCADGMYDNVPLNMKDIGCKEVGWFHIRMRQGHDKEIIEPFIIVKQGRDKYGQINGNPYHETSQDEMAALLKMQQLRNQPKQPQA